MSEERRKRQHERDGVTESEPVSRKTWMWIGIVALAILAWAAFWYHDMHRYDAFAKCVTSKQAKMYGLYWCPHCAEQKKDFGKSFQYINYVECAIKGSKDLAPACQAAGVKLFPSWQFEGNPPKEGVLSLEELGDKTGCSLP